MLRTSTWSPAGQATIPMVYAVQRAVAEAGRSALRRDRRRSSVSAGPGTRANIDEFTKTTSRVSDHRWRKAGKAIIILNPADPPMIMRDTIFCAIPEDADRDAITKSIHDVVAEVQTYVPGCRLLNEPQFDEPSVVSGGNFVVTTFVRSRGRRLPASLCGNLDIMTAAPPRSARRSPKQPRVSPEEMTDIYFNPSGTSA